jgi:ATP-dependent RNA helicase DHX57
MEDEEEEDMVDGDEEDVIQSYVIQRLVHEGFTPSQVRRGYRAVFSDKSNSMSNGSDQQMDKAYEETLQYLCIHLSEDQLPMGFDPRGGTLDVVRPAAKTKSNTNEQESKEDNSSAAPATDQKYDTSVMQFARQFGLTPKEAFTVLFTELPAEMKPLSNISGSSELMQKWKLWNVLCRAAALPIERTCFVDNAKTALHESLERNREAASNELEALEAIFDGQDFSTAKSEDKMISVSIGLPYDNAKLFLEVIYFDGHYPDLLPMAFLTTDGGSDFCQGGRLQVKLAQFLCTLEPGQEAIFELFGHIQELLQDSTMDDTSSVLLSHLHIKDSEERSTSLSKTNDTIEIDNDQNNQVELSVPRPSSRAKPTRRPREKSSFWNTPPKATPPAESSPKLSITLEKARNSLPAAKARSEFLSLMEQASLGGRVLLVTGETG